MTKTSHRWLNFSCAVLVSFCLGLAPLPMKAAETDPILVIQAPEKKLSFKRSELLARKDVTQIQVPHDPAYPGMKMTYTAVPLAPLFESVTVPPDATLLFRCLDGFSAPISTEKVLNRSKNKAVAYLAIETPNEKWPKVDPKASSSTTPAPYYLVWTHPEASKITTEEWPFQLSGFEVKQSLRAIYPAIFPDPKLKADHPVNRGLRVFTKNCFTCHTLNRQGESKVGPDLNIPMNPTEYLQTKALKILIRNPQNLREWPNSRMRGFPENEVSDSDLDDLVTYLKHMSQRKVK